MEKTIAVEFKMILSENGKQIETANVSVPIFDKFIEFETTHTSGRKQRKEMTNPFNVEIVKVL